VQYGSQKEKPGVVGGLEGEGCKKAGCEKEAMRIGCETEGVPAVTAATQHDASSYCGKEMPHVASSCCGDGSQHVASSYCGDGARQLRTCSAW
jgi:hypothetical protein